MDSFLRHFGITAAQRKILQLMEEIARLREEIARLRVELDKWPRVFWHSSNPDSLEKGYRVMSVSGKESEKGDGWMSVDVKCPGPDGDMLAAPVDFGLYSTSEEAKAAIVDKLEPQEILLCPECGCNLTHSEKDNYYSCPNHGRFAKSYTYSDIELVKAVDGDKFGPHSYGAHDGTSDCAYGCGCWMGPYRSNGPVNPFGPCPNNPITREAAQAAMKESE